MIEKQAVIPVYIGDRGTCLIVSRHVRQLVRLTKSLSVSCSAYPSRYVDFFSNNIFPDIINGFAIGNIFCQCGDVCHACVHIGRAHGMSYGFMLVGYLAVCLVVFVFSRAAYIEKEFSGIEVFLITRYLV